MSRLDVGEVVLRTSLEIEWRIPDFFSLPQKVDEYIGSHSFFFRGGNWCIELFPNGETEDQFEGYIGIYLYRKDKEGPPRKVTYTFSFKSADGELKLSRKYTYTLPSDYPGYGCPKFLKRSELIEKKEELAPSDCLTIVCSLRMFQESAEVSEKVAEVATQTQSEHLHSVSSQASERVVEAATQTSSEFMLSEPTASQRTHTPSECSIEKLSRDLNQLLSSGEDSDMTVHVKEKEFRLHRGIMGTRVPVFSAMFQHEMREKATGSVSIDDCEVEVFQDFVYYVYSGRVDKLHAETAFGLFMLADKYQVLELKSACFEFVKHTLSVDTFCDVVNLALTYDERQLLRQATDFLADNMTEIMKTVRWMNFMKERLIQANELLLKAIEKKIN